MKKRPILRYIKNDFSRLIPEKDLLLKYNVNFSKIVGEKENMIIRFTKDKFNKNSIENEINKICIMYSNEHKVFYYTIYNTLLYQQYKKDKTYYKMYITQYIDDIYVDFILTMSQYIKKYVSKSCIIETNKYYDLNLVTLYKIVIFYFSKYKFYVLKTILSSKYKFFEKELHCDYQIQNNDD